MASVAQRSAAAPAPGELSFSWRLATYLVHRPVWFLGIFSMTLGFVFQVWALRMGSLSLVQPVIATELVIVFGIMALQDRHRVRRRDWLSAIGIVIPGAGPAFERTVSLVDFDVDSDRSVHVRPCRCAHLVGPSM
jgi:drug/metabolite transporter (DMT)-like permease